MRAAALRSVTDSKDPADIAATQARIEAKLDEILKLLTRQRALSREDLRALARMLPAIGGALGSEPFLARDLIASDNRSVRLVVQGYSSKRLGKLFMRAAGQQVDGYVVEEAGEELRVVLWRVLKYSEL